MTRKMKCFVMHRIGEVGMTEKPIPRAGPNDAIIRTSAALICTSDTHTVAGAIGDRHGLTLGHEAVGVIHELGELAAASGLFRIGRHVAVGAITPCCTCDNCQHGYPSQCGGMLGGWKFANVKDGSFAEYFHVNNAVANLAPIPRRSVVGLRTRHPLQFRQQSLDLSLQVGILYDARRTGVLCAHG